MDDGGYSMNFNVNSSKGPLPIKKGPPSGSGCLPPEDLPLQDQFTAAMEWKEELLCNMEEIVMEENLKRNPCPLIEMFICPQEMMGILLKTVI